MILEKQISIITPSFNQASFLSKTISSVIEQKSLKIELIIIDGGSDDTSIDIIKRLEDKITYWISEPDSGQSEAINKGIKIAKGDIINWLNADDYYEPDALSIVARNFDDPNVKVLIGKSRLFQNDKTISYSRGTDVYPENLTKTIGWCRIDQPETFFTKEAWGKVGLLNEQLHYTMDREWWMRYLYIFGLNGIRRIVDVLVNFRLHEDSKTVSSKDKFQIEHDTIFYILSTLSSNKSIQEVISKTLNLDLSLDSLIRNWTDSNLIEGSLNYYLLKRAEELYYQEEHEISRDLLSCIDHHYIQKEDLKLLHKIGFRNRLPKFLVSFFRKK